MIKVSNDAIAKISELIQKSQKALPNNELFLRITALPKGCSGLKYQTYFDYEKRDGDHLYTFDTFEMRVDKDSAPYLLGTKVEYFDTIEKQGFFIDNPSSLPTCSCNGSCN
jgi:iron-sulfur cluster assembly accessory protein